MVVLLLHSSYLVLVLITIFILLKLVLSKSTPSTIRDNNYSSCKKFNSNLNNNNNNYLCFYLKKNLRNFDKIDKSFDNKIFLKHKNFFISILFHFFYDGVRDHQHNENIAIKLKRFRNLLNKMGQSKSRNKNAGLSSENIPSDSDQPSNSKRRQSVGRKFSFSSLTSSRRKSVVNTSGNNNSSSSDNLNSVDVKPKRKFSFSLSPKRQKKKFQQQQNEPSEAVAIDVIQSQPIDHKDENFYEYPINEHENIYSYIDEVKHINNSTLLDNSEIIEPKIIEKQQSIEKQNNDKSIDNRYSSVTSTSATDRDSYVTAKTWDDDDSYQSADDENVIAANEPKTPHPQIVETVNDDIHLKISDMVIEHFQKKRKLDKSNGTGIARRKKIPYTKIENDDNIKQVTIKTLAIAESTKLRKIGLIDMIDAYDENEFVTHRNPQITIQPVDSVDDIIRAEHFSKHFSQYSISDLLTPNMIEQLESDTTEFNFDKLKVEDVPPTTVSPPHQSSSPPPAQKKTIPEKPKRKNLPVKVNDVSTPSPPPTETKPVKFGCSFPNIKSLVQNFESTESLNKIQVEHVSSVQQKELITQTHAPEAAVHAILKHSTSVENTKFWNEPYTNSSKYDDLREIVFEKMAVKQQKAPPQQLKQVLSFDDILDEEVFSRRFSQYSISDLLDESDDMNAMAINNSIESL